MLRQIITRTLGREAPEAHVICDRCEWVELCTKRQSCVPIAREPVDPAIVRAIEALVGGEGAR